MSKLGIFNPTSLVGMELKEQLERRRSTWEELRLLVLEAEEFEIADVAGEAALVQEANADTLGDLDVLFACPKPGEEPADVLPKLAAAKTIIYVSPRRAVPEGRPVVDGVNLASASAEGLLVSPHPGVVALAHLLHPLRAVGLESAVCWAMQPASTYDQAGVDELLDQTRGILAFSSEYPKDVFGRQLAMNLFPAESAPADLGSSLGRVLGDDLAVSAELLQGSFFHSVAVSARVRCAEDAGADAVRKALLASPYLESAEGPPPGPVEAAGSAKLLVGPVAADPSEDGAFWIWGVMDNLTLGGATNALAIGDALLQQPN